jgi:HAD superfamily hydrolase (TIGR01509 family)
MPIRAIIFDFGGVLMRTHDYTARQKWADRLGLPERELENAVFGSTAATRGMLGELPPEATWDDAAATFHLDEEALRQFQDDFWSGDRLDRELIDFLAGLRPRYKTALLSNAWSDARALFTERFGLDRAVDLMVISAEEHLAKPDARIYQLTLDRLGVRPEEAVFVDDMPTNVEAARAVGMAGVRFQSTGQVIAEVQARLAGE